MKPKARKRKEIINIQAEIQDIELKNPKTKKLKTTMKQMNETGSWLFEKFNKIDSALSRLTKNKKESTQINKITNERGEITTNATEIQTITREYCEKLYANELTTGRNGQIPRHI